MSMRGWPISERIAASVRQEGECLVWTKLRVRNGYGRISIKNREYMAHRVAYELAKGPIPDGLELDHLCRNRACVNPDHLEPVTRKENVRRGMHPSAVAMRNRTCRNGHPESESYRRKSTGNVVYCRACARERRAAKRAAA